MPLGCDCLEWQLTRLVHSAIAVVRLKIRNLKEPLLVLKVNHRATFPHLAQAWNGVNNTWWAGTVVIEAGDCTKPVFYFNNSRVNNWFKYAKANPTSEEVRMPITFCHWKMCCGCTRFVHAKITPNQDDSEADGKPRPAFHEAFATDACAHCEEPEIKFGRSKLDDGLAAHVIAYPCCCVN